MKHRFCVAYARTSYMEVEVEAENARQAEAIFESAAKTNPSACECGKRLTPPQYRIIDVVATEAMPIELQHQLFPDAA
ncbi:MAG TPA: hypothetical protein VGU20_05215 [Stellaceae bacterium]|nr:hypothetical protein [Stellaceae bacterium]